VTIVATLGRAGDSVSIDATAPFGASCSVLHLDNGHFVVSGLVGGGELGVYDAQGKWIRAVGRPGHGPGEFQRQLDLATVAGDTFEVFDRFNLRATKATSAGEFLGSFRTPEAANGLIAMGRDRWLVLETPGSAAVRDSLFVLVDDSGAVVRAFGASSPALADLDAWTAARGRDGDLFTASVWHYEIYHWTNRGKLEETFLRHAPWFPDAQVVTPRRLDRMFGELPPVDYLEHIAVDDRGRLWTFSLIPDPDWTPGPTHFTSPAWTRHTFDTMVEVVDVRDPVRARVVASRRFDSVVAPICGRDLLLYRLIETAVGDTRAEILAPRVTVAGHTPETDRN
jgi:hypothetical protein